MINSFFLFNWRRAIEFGLRQLKYEHIRGSYMVIGYLNGHDVFLCSQTGSGKSLNYF